jgi:hypothetical protein
MYVSGVINIKQNIAKLTFFQVTSTLTLVWLGQTGNSHIAVTHCLNDEDVSVEASSFK